MTLNQLVRSNRMMEPKLKMPQLRTIKTLMMKKTRKLKRLRVSFQLGLDLMASH